MYTLADQLKYFDPVYERMMYEPNNSTDDGGVGGTHAPSMEDQPWLQGLSATLRQYNVGSFYIFTTKLM